MNYYTSNTKIINAVCVIDGEAKGIIYLRDNGSSTEIWGRIIGLTPGYHGFHIHEAGDLTELNCLSCCGHYNPFGKNHGGPQSEERHIGDLGNIWTNYHGVSVVGIIDNFVKLSGPMSVIGRSIVIHEDADDFGMGNHSDSLTTGHSGRRIGCGVIGYAKSC